MVETHVKEPDPPHLRWPLRLGGERRNEEPEDEGEQEYGPRPARSAAHGASVLTAGLGPNPTLVGNGALHQHTFVVGVWPPIATANDRISPALIHGDKALGRFRSVERHELRTSA